MMLAKAKDIQANFVGHDRHADHIFQALVRTDLLVRVGVRNEFTEAMNADFHDSSSPSPFLCLGRHNSLFPSSHAMAQFSPSQDPASSCVALPTWINGWDSAQARSSTSPTSSVRCAPDPPYLSSTAKQRTPLIPKALSHCSSARTSSAYASLPTTPPTSSPSIPISKTSSTTVSSSPN